MADPISFRKGTIISYDQTTGDNVVEVGGAQISDVPVLGVAEAATYVAGASVGILVVDTGGSQSWFIIGRIVRPNTSDYTDAVNRLSNSIYTDQVDSGTTTTTTTFGDLTTFGPVCYPVVKSSQKLLIFMSAVIIADDTDVANGGLMSVEIKDGTTGSIIYGAGTLPNVGYYYSDNATHALGDSMEATRLILVSLSAGPYIVTSKYRAQGTSNTTFSFRNLTCIAV